MKLTQNEYRDLIKKHPNLADTREPAKLEQPIVQKLVRGKKDKDLGTETVRIEITDVRKRLTDDDNLCEKFLVDCLRREGYIKDDSVKYVRIFTTQRKCTNREEPHTLIEIY